MVNKGRATHRFGQRHPGATPMDKQQDHVAVLRDMLTDYATGADGSGPTTISAEEAALTAAISALTVDEAMIARAEAYMLRVLPSKSTACLGGNFNFHDLLQAAIQGESRE